jgi:uncharacterized membrane protein YphA (DoxX/SURF4 family)
MNKSPQTIATLVARVLLGLIFFVFGLNGFLHFIPAPPPGPEALAFVGALAATGYMFPLIKAIEVIAGVLLLSNRAVPFALVLLAPIVVNIAAFHIVLEPGYGMVATLGVLMSYLGYAYRAEFAPLFGSKGVARKEQPVASAAPAH